MLTTLVFRDGPVEGRELAVAGDWYIGAGYVVETLIRSIWYGIHRPWDMVESVPAIRHTYRLKYWGNGDVGQMFLDDTQGR